MDDYEEKDFWQNFTTIDILKIDYIQYGDNLRLDIMKTWMSIYHRLNDCIKAKRILDKLLLLFLYFYFYIILIL